MTDSNIIQNFGKIKSEGQRKDLFVAIDTKN